MSSLHACCLNVHFTIFKLPFKQRISACHHLSPVFRRSVSRLLQTAQKQLSNSEQSSTKQELSVTGGLTRLTRGEVGLIAFGLFYKRKYELVKEEN